jgi:alpha/beta superfamily hydrolase
MRRRAPLCFALAAVWLVAMVARPAASSVPQQVIDIPTRPGVTQRFLLQTPPQPRATVVLFPGGHGGLQLDSAGRFQWGGGNFLVRSRGLFVDRGLAAVVVDAPSDRQSAPFLSGFRQTREHVDDVKAVIAWLREHVQAPVWLVGTSRGTQSAAFVATQLTGRDGPDGLVLTSTILTDTRERPVPAMDLDKLRIPVLVVHHEQDGCSLCLFRDVPLLMKKLDAVPKKELVAFKGGDSRGDPCEAFAYHGYHGIESEVIDRIAAWIVAAR